MVDFIENDVSPLETLVGEGRKYKDEVELARAYISADETIEQRNRELAELRDELNRRLTAEQILEQARNQGIERQAAEVQNNPAAEPARPPSTDDLVRLIRETTEADNNQRKSSDNINSVAARLIEVEGDATKANEFVANKAAELGLDVAFLQSVAAKSPKAFYEAVGLNESPRSSATPSTSDVNPQALARQVSNVGVVPGTYKYYEEIRKTTPALYFSPKIQNKMHSDAQAKGEAFFN